MINSTLVRKVPLDIFCSPPSANFELWFIKPAIIIFWGQFKETLAKFKAGKKKVKPLAWEDLKGSVKPLKQFMKAMKVMKKHCDKRAIKHLGL